MLIIVTIWVPTSYQAVWENRVQTGHNYVTAGSHKLLLIFETKQLFIIVEKEFLAILQGCDIIWGDIYGKQQVNGKVPSSPG